ncbi:unnamed protein product, partial [Mesorhabditis spiculigera]
MVARATPEETEMNFNSRLNPGFQPVIDAMKRHLIAMISGSLPIWSFFVSADERMFVEQEWALITERMNLLYPRWHFTEQLLRGQWKILRACYQRERKRLLANARRPIKWKFYEEMQFLEDSGMHPPVPPRGVDPDGEQWMAQHKKLTNEMLERSRAIAKASRHYLTGATGLEVLKAGIPAYETRMTFPKQEVQEPVEPEYPPDFNFSRVLEGAEDYEDGLDGLDVQDELDGPSSGPSSSTSNDGPGAPLPFFPIRPYGGSAECRERLSSFPLTQHGAYSAKKRTATDTNQITEPKSDKYELLGRSVAQTLSQHGPGDELIVEETVIEIEEALQNFRKKMIKMKRFKQENGRF